MRLASSDEIYEVTGIVVEQSYGMVDVWVQEVRKLGDGR